MGVDLEARRRRRRRGNGENGDQGDGNQVPAHKASLESEPVARMGTLMRMDDLYREQILEQYKRPHHFGRLDDYDLYFEDTNPFCGDEQHVFIKLDGEGRVA